MTDYCGWIGYRASQDDGHAVLRAMTERLPPPRAGEALDVWVGDRCALASVGRPSVMGDRNSRRVVWSGTPRLGDGGQGADQVARSIGDALDDGDSASVSRLRGGFSLVAMDDDSGSGCLAVDRIGGRFPLSYAALPEGLVFSTRSDAVLAHPQVRSSLSAQSIYDYVYFHVLPGPCTMWTDVFRLPPATAISVRAGRVSMNRYWRPRYRGVAGRPEDLAREFRALLERAVGRVAVGEPGCFLSGGVDSSTVSGLVGKLSGAPPSTFSIGFDSERFDEMDYARAVVRHFGMRHAEYQVTPEDVLSLIEQIPGVYAEPFGNASAVPTFFCAKLAREHGVTRMLAGDGGDELFGGNARYAKQKVFEYYSRFPKPIREQLVEPLLRMAPGERYIPLLAKARSYVRQAKLPLAKRIESYNHVERLGASAIFEPGFLDSIDPDRPLRQLTEELDGADAVTLVDRLLSLDLKLTLADSDLPKVQRMCAHAGVDVDFPLLDEDILDFSLSLPTDFKVRGSQLRWFMKYALSDFLPEVVLTKKKHGFGLPFGLWLTEHDGLQETCWGALSRLSQRSIVRPSFVERLRELHRESHPTYYGVLIWVLVQLELWLESRGL